ncbi:hypothetical protein EXS65_03515 [Candidatus Peribacteria bacterium]|nr:hypothetical protein [Candidatus Peribacteria bacterium]
MELLSALGVDLGVLLSQVLNYGILLAVLTFLLYRPVLNLLDARRESIRKAMEDSERIAKQAEEMEAMRKKQMVKIEADAAGLLEQAKKDVALVKEQMLAEAKKEADTQLARGKEELLAEKSRITGDLEKVAASLVVKLTSKLLEKEFSAADQDRLMSALESSVTHSPHAKK